MPVSTQICFTTLYVPPTTTTIRTTKSDEGVRPTFFSDVTVHLRGSETGENLRKRKETEILTQRQSSSPETQPKPSGYFASTGGRHSDRQLPLSERTMSNANVRLAFGCVSVGLLSRMYSSTSKVICVIGNYVFSISLLMSPPLSGILGLSVRLIPLFYNYVLSCFFV